MSHNHTGPSRSGLPLGVKPQWPERATGPNVLALEWIDEAMRLERELVELRQFCQALFVWVLAHEDLSGYARAQIDRRFPDAQEEDLAA